MDTRMPDITDVRKKKAVSKAVTKRNKQKKQSQTITHEPKTQKNGVKPMRDLIKDLVEHRNQPFLQPKLVEQVMTARNSP